MSRKSRSAAVSLFPFLAVLVSAMGALILLLLVTTRKLRNDAVEQAQVAAAQTAAAQEAEAAPEIPWAAQPLPADDAAFQTDAALFVIAVKSPAKQLLPPPTPPVPDRSREREALQREWEAKLAELQAAWEQLQQRVAEKQTLLQEQQTREAELAAELARLRGDLARALDGKTDREKSLLSIQSAEKTLTQKIAEAQAELDRLKAEQAAAKDKFQLVPYAGTSPTQRRPIVIECLADRLVFASEEVSISAADTNGFNSGYNPVKAGLAALLNHAEEQRNSASSLAARPPEPYVLFVIRPGGTVSYYVARRLVGQMLDEARIESGYELVLDSQEMVWPVADEEAQTACREAVDEVLSERARVVATLPGGQLPPMGEMQYSDPQGNFILSEVNQLRNPERKTFVGGQRMTRVERPRSGFPGFTPPQSAREPSEFVGPRLDDMQPDPGSRAARGTPTPSQTGDAMARRGTPVPNRPFPTEPPPREGTGSAEGTGSGTGDEMVQVTPRRDRQPGWKQLEAKGTLPIQTAERDPATQRPQPMTPRGFAGPEQPDADSIAPDAEGTPNGSAEGSSPGSDSAAQAIAARLPSPFQLPPPNSIAAERFVIVTIDAQSVQVGSQGPSTINTSESTEQLMREFARHLGETQSRWGRPPAGFRWQPAIRFRVKPGGNLYYAQLQTACEQWGIRSSLEYVFD